jgi:predicted TIM-barrel fold metal-dependent hydrolase
MQPPPNPTEAVNDIHCHFLSPRFFEALGREKHGASGGSSRQIATELGWEDPGSVEALADRWVAELDRHRTSRAALIGSVAGDEDSIAAAIARHPRRFVGFFALNPAAPDSAERAARAFGELGLRCACLFPALHRYALDSEQVEKVFEAAASNGGAIFAHCGHLWIEARAKLGLPSARDLRFGDPLALAATAAKFPTVPVIVPHFGAGFFREALMAADVCPTIHFDTSSSNSWVKFNPGLTLAEVFRRTLAVVGPDRVIFGTDSSFFPRGWRQVIHGAQQTALDEAGVEPAIAARIFSRNFDRMFGEA